MGPIPGTLVTGSSRRDRGRDTADDGRGVGAGRKRAEGAAPTQEAPAVVGQPRPGKRVGHGGVAVPDEQGALEGERHGLGEMTGAGFGRVAEFLTQPDDRLI